MKGIFAVTDRGRMPCADYMDTNRQNAYFNGFRQRVEVTNLFVFILFGELSHAAVHYHAFSHDTKLETVPELYFPKLSDELTTPGHGHTRRKCIFLQCPGNERKNSERMEVHQDIGYTRVVVPFCG